jgi:hypothetical protein
MHLDLTDEETAALLSLLLEVIVRNDRHPHVPRIEVLRAIFAELRGGDAPIITKPNPPA